MRDILKISLNYLYYRTSTLQYVLFDFTGISVYVMSLLILVFFLFILYFSANAERKISKEKYDNITKHRSFCFNSISVLFYSCGARI